MSFQSTELHLLQTPDDFDRAEKCGLPTEHSACANCRNDLGMWSAKFTPVVIVLNENEQWALCLDCARPALSPTSW